MTIWSLDVLLSLLGTSLLFHVQCPVLTVASWSAYKFLKRQVRWSGISICLRFPQLVLSHTVKVFGVVNKAKIDVFIKDIKSFFVSFFLSFFRGFPCGSDGKKICLQCRRLQCRDCSFNPRVRKIPWRRDDYPLQDSCLENPMERGTWQAIVHGITKSWTWLSNKQFHFPMWHVGS